MTFSLRVTARARDDITRNAAWWAEHYSLDQALRWYDRVYDQLDTILEFPESHSLSAENDKFPYEIRDKLVGFGSRPRYRAVFTIQCNEVIVLTVRAGQEDRLTSDDIDVQ